MIKPTKYPMSPDDLSDLFGEAVTQGKQGKQDTLVSGTNIKTINGASVLGSGDLTVSGSGASWGSITGTLSSQDDLQDALDAKQNTLVSGTSIKTVNGNSLLGSGNLTISGGLTGYHNALNFLPTGYGIGAMTASVSTAGIQPNGNLIYLNPFILNKSLSFTQMRINVSGAVAGSNVRVVMYTDNGGMPNAKIFESADISCATTGIKTISNIYTLNAGTVYWIGIHPSASPTFTAINQASVLPIAHPITMTGAPVTTWTYNYTYGTAPLTLNQAVRGVWQGAVTLILFIP